MRAEWRWGAEKHLDSFVYILVVYFFSPLVTGAIYEFNSKTGARKWKDSLTKCQNGKSPAPRELLQEDLSLRKGPGHQGALTRKEMV